MGTNSKPQRIRRVYQRIPCKSSKEEETKEAHLQPYQASSTRSRGTTKPYSELVTATPHGQQAKPSLITSQWLSKKCEHSQMIKEYATVGKPLKKPRN
jgi:hypothetical protein